MAKKKSIKLQNTTGKVTRTNAGVRIYPPSGNGSKQKYWRIVWMEDKQQKETTATSDVNATKKALEISKSILAGGTSNPQKSCGEMIADYFQSKMDPANTNWGEKHTLNIQNLFDNHITEHLEYITCINLRNTDLQKIIKKAPTHSLASHIYSAISALVHWGISSGYLLTSPAVLLKDVKRKNIRRIKRSGEGRLYVDPRLIPDHDSVSLLAEKSAEISGEWWHELMINLASYSGLRFGEIIDLDPSQIDLKAQSINVTHQVLEINGRFVRKLPKWDTIRKTTFPKVTPNGYELHKMLKKRIKEVMEISPTPTLQDGTSRALLFPNSQNEWISASSYGKYIRRPAQSEAKWPINSDGKYIWNFHSLRHVFCSWYFSQGKDIVDIAKAAGHSSPTTTMEMYLGYSDGAIERLKI